MEVVQRVAKARQTGIVSVTVDEGAKRLYGTLWLRQGKIVSAQYLDLKGREAFEALKQVPASSVSFTSTPVMRGDPALSEPAPAAETLPQARPRRGGRLKIFPRVLLTMLLVALLPLAGLWLVNYLSLRREVEASVAARLAQASELVTAQVNDWMSTSVQGMRQASYLIDMNALMAEPNLRHPVLIAMSEALAWRPRGIAVAPDGMQVGRADGVDAVFVGDREYFRQAVELGGVGHQVIMSRTHGTPTLCMAIPHYQGGEMMGAMSLCGDLAVQVAEFLAAPRIAAGTVLFITDAGDRLLAHTAMTLPGDDFLDYSRHPALLAPRGQLIRYDDGGVEKVAHSQRTDLGWTVVVEQPVSEAYAELRTVERQAAVLLLVALALIVGMSYLLARRLVKPIQNLTAVADGISRGELDADIPEAERRDELGELAAAIARLRMSVRVAMQELAQR